MPITMNEKSMKEALDPLRGPREAYIAYTWATIHQQTSKLLSYTTTSQKNPRIGFRNIYSYLGVSKENIMIVTLHALDVTKATACFRIPIKEITTIYATYGLLRSKMILTFEQEQIRIDWMNESFGMDLKQQRNAVKRICHYVNTVNKSV